nr:hypothetical protein B11C_200046 [Bartonella sp. 1-1C]
MICKWIPKNGCVADPTLSIITLGRGVMVCPLVSVCHHVSRMGQRLSPTV